MERRCGGIYQEGDGRAQNILRVSSRLTKEPWAKPMALAYTVTAERTFKALPCRRVVIGLQDLIKFVVLHMQAGIQLAQLLNEEIRHLGQILFTDDWIIDAPGERL